jgi:hypothetical protein
MRVLVELHVRPAFVVSVVENARVVREQREEHQSCPRNPFVDEHESDLPAITVTQMLTGTAYRGRYALRPLYGRILFRLSEQCFVLTKSN